jgi:hypothetical protein
MGEIVLFVPKKELNAAFNVADFVKLCRVELTVFGSALDWEKNDWDVSDFVEIKGRKGRIAVIFSTYDAAGSKSLTATMAQPFLDFAKAYMRYQHSLRPTKSLNQRMSALRALEKVLKDRSLDGVPRIEKTDPEILNQASRLIQKTTPSSAYWVSGQLQILADFLVEHHLVISRFSWKNPVKKPDDTNIRVGAEFEERRSRKLPSAEAIDALIEAYRIAKAPKDVIVSSIAALLVCSPDRINEVFSLPVDCEHRTTYQGEEAYGIRWWPSKGADPTIKWVVKSLWEVAQESIERLKKHTEGARAMARWYETNPGKLYLPQGCEHLRSKEFVTANDLLGVFGFATKTSVTRWLQERDVPSYESQRQQYQVGRLPATYRFTDVEKAVVAMLPVGFPYYDKDRDLKYSESLILVPYNFMHEDKGTYRCMFDIVTTDTFNNQLGAGERHQKSSIFSRLGLRDAQGNPFKITTHQFRHWLNTLAQHAGLSQLHIAKWSGRKDIRQNASYDHLSGGELIARARELSGGKMFGPIADFVVRAPISREEFLKLSFPTAHVTEYGFCIHDWTTMPCQKYRDCLLCTDHVCVKGNLGSEALIRRLVEAEELLERARKATEEGYFGADRWLEHHQKIVEVLRGHREILDDPAISADSVYQLSNIREYSPVTLAIEERMTHDDPDAAALRMVMERLAALQSRGGGPDSLAIAN